MSIQEQMVCRAKRLDTGEWVEGTGVTDFVNLYPNKKGCWIWTKYYCWAEIDPSTLCRYTEREVAGEKVFEGDIFRDQFNRVVEVFWAEHALQWQFRDNKRNLVNARMNDWFSMGEVKLEKIGSRVDNPEMMEMK